MTTKRQRLDRDLVLQLAHEQCVPPRVIASMLQAHPTYISAIVSGRTRPSNARHLRRTDVFRVLNMNRRAMQRMSVDAIAARFGTSPYYVKRWREITTGRI